MREVERRDSERDQQEGVEDPGWCVPVSFLRFCGLTDSWFVVFASAWLGVITLDYDE
jgi:hypothetical protein